MIDPMESQTPPETDDASQAAPEPPGPAAPDWAAELAAAQAEAADLKDKLLRALAEQENQRRRLERERDEAAKYAIARFARDLLTVADNLQRALEAQGAGAEAAPDAPRTGIAAGGAARRRAPRPPPPATPLPVPQPTAATIPSRASSTPKRSRQPPSRRAQLS